MGLDLTLFVFALSFVSAYGVLPLFVHHLSASNLALGAIPAVRASSLLPPLFVAGLIERLRRKKPFIIVCTVIERLPYLCIAIATPLLATTHPAVLLWFFFVMLALAILAGGVATPAWLDLIARMIPANWRGRFFGLSSALGGVLGVMGSAGAAFLLRRFSWSTGCALCFACAFVCLVISFVFIALGREPMRAVAVEASVADAVTLPQPERIGRRVLMLLRNDRNLCWYLVAIVLVTSAGAAASFYIVDAKRALALSDGAASLYAVVLLAAATGGNILWGYIGDHLGHKRIVVIGALCTALAPLLALIIRYPRFGPLGYGGVFLLVGLGTSALQLTALTFIIDFAPMEQRPTFIGVATMAQAPFAFGAPLLCAVIADRGGYAPVFVLAALLALVGMALVSRFVRDPRMEAARHALPMDAA
ncbi:MAG: MFS transporter [Thermomicrobiales bacterium]